MIASILREMPDRRNGCLPSCVDPSLGLHHTNCQHYNKPAAEPAPEPTPEPTTEDPVRPSPPGTCVVCLDMPSTHAMVPCGHLCVCAECHPKLPAQSPCPICRSHVYNIIRIHDAGAPAPAPAPAHASTHTSELWYTMVEVAGRWYTRDTDDQIYDLETQILVGSWSAKYVCENACGFGGSWKDCMEHEQGCRYDGPLDSNIAQSVLGL